MAGGQAEAGADGAHRVRAQHLPRRHVAHHIEGPAELAVAGLVRPPAIVGLPQGLPGVAAVLHQPHQLVRLQAEGGVRPAIGPGQGHVLLDHHGPQRHTGHRRRGARRVVRQTRQTAEIRRQPGDGPQVRVGEAGGIGAHTVQQHHAPCPRPPGRRHRIADLLRRGHAGGDDQRPPGAGGPCDQGQVDGLEGRDLVGGGVQALEQFHRRLVEGGGEHDQPQVPGAAEQGFVPLIGGEGLPIELVQGATGPQARLQPEARPVMADGDGVRRVGLQLHRIRAGPGAHLHQPLGPVEVAVMIAAQFGNDQRGRVRRHPTAGNVDGQGFGGRHAGAILRRKVKS